MPYRIDMNLQQIAALNAAISFWNKPHVKDKIIEFFNFYDEHDDKEARSHWNQLTKEVLETWHNNTLPRKLNGELIHVTKEIGRRMFDWSQYIKRKNTLYPDAEPQIPEETNMYISCICWTSYGTIDEVKTYKKFLMKNPNFNAAKLYKIACHNAVEDGINYLWRKIPKPLRRKLEYDMDKDDNPYILAYWKYRRDGNLDYFRSCFDEWDEHWDDDLPRVRDPFDFPLYDESLSIEENMLLISAQKGYYNAVKYFWGKLTAEKRNNNLLELVHIALRCYSNYGDKNESVVNYKREKWIEIFLFLMPQMTAEQKEVFHNTTLEVILFEDYDERNVNDVILWIFPHAWPWQNLLIPALNDMFRRQKLSVNMTYFLLCEMSSKMVEQHQLGYNVINSKFQSLFQAVWWNLPRNIKQGIAEDPCFMPDYNKKQHFSFSLLDVWDLDSIDIIFNDPEVADFRDKLLQHIDQTYEELIIGDKYDVLDQFIDKILRSESEKAEFKQNIDALEHFVLREEFHLADKFLDWQWSSPEEKEFEKSLNDCILDKIIFEKEQYDLADKFLDWSCVTEEQKKMCKDQFINGHSYSRSVDWVCRTWIRYSSDVDKAVEKSSRFLNWLFESENEMRIFKRAKLAYAVLIKSSLIPTGIKDQFFHWCSLTEEEFQQIMRMH